MQSNENYEPFKAQKKPKKFKHAVTVNSNKSVKKNFKRGQHEHRTSKKDSLS